jgi:outer membrane protein OmpA-like peptidoglycan-associated protein
VRLDARAWLGVGAVNHHDRPYAGLDASVGVELRPVPPRDRDKDGFLDADDACPDEPEDFDRLLDHDGCPDDDVDGDHIPDTRDRCATRPETANGYQDADGCPDIVPEAVLALPEPLRAFTGSIEGIEFAVDSAEILPQSETVLSASAKVLNEFPTVRIAIHGHTDSTADDAHNLALSTARAQAVAAWLGAHGVDPARITAEGFGETRPIDTNETEEGRAHNRRVEFVIVAR